MRVILKQDVKSLGKKGSICEFQMAIRNYLIPRNLAVEATEGNVRI